MRRGPYAKVAQRNAALLERIRDLKAEHPFWGYRRICAHLRYVDGLAVNPKRVYSVMKRPTCWCSRTSNSGRAASPTPGSRGRPGPTNGGAST